MGMESLASGVPVRFLCKRSNDNTVMFTVSDLWRSVQANPLLSLHDYRKTTFQVLFVITCFSFAASAADWHRHIQAVRLSHAKTEAPFLGRGRFLKALSLKSAIRWQQGAPVSIFWPWRVRQDERLSFRASKRPRSLPCARELTWQLPSKTARTW